MSYTLETAIGKGVLFPITLTQNSEGQTTWAPVVGEVSLIENNIYSLVQHVFGDRIREENFGTRLIELIEEPTVQTLLFLAKLYLRSSIEYWEPRVKFLALVAKQSKYSMEFTITYQVILTQSVESLDFSFNPQTGETNVSK